MHLIDVESFVDVPGVLPVRSPAKVASLFDMASRIFGCRLAARDWIHDCNEGDLSILHECAEAATNWSR